MLVISSEHDVLKLVNVRRRRRLSLFSVRHGVRRQQHATPPVPLGQFSPNFPKCSLDGLYTKS